MFERRLSVKGARYALVGMLVAIYGFAWIREPGQGTDDRARQLIGEIAPNFRSWIDPVWTPGSRIEMVLFLVQGFIGIGLFSFVCLRIPVEQEQ